MSTAVQAPVSGWLRASGRDRPAWDAAAALLCGCGGHAPRDTVQPVVAEISVIVPVYQVEEFLEPCLRSIAEQTRRDLEIIVVDDGSTDGSLEIAERFAERDRRLRIIRQPNRGLGNARNTGLAASDAEFAMFVDSDDLLLPRALERLRASLSRTGSDFATGMVHRYTRGGSRPVAFMRKTFLRNRPRTHVSRFPWLVSDRVAWIVPAHYLARAVDVVRDPVYLWRLRAGSITARRTEPGLMHARLRAVRRVCDFLVEAPLPAIQRLKWHLVRRRPVPELLEVLRFERQEFKTRPRVVRGVAVYGAYPFFDDPELGIPRSVYRLDRHRRRLRSAIVLARPARVPRRALR